MSAFSNPLVPLLVAAVAVAVGCAALLAARRLHRDLVTLRREVARALTAAPAGLVPGARTASHSEEIRAAVVDALADERERELAEARAFWAAQEAKEAADAPIFDGPGFDGPGTFDHSGTYNRTDATDRADAYGYPDIAEFQYVTDFPDVTEFPGIVGHQGVSEFEVLPFLPRQGDHLPAGEGGETEPATADRRRHPSDPEFAPGPAVADPEQTVARLSALAQARTPLADVRPGPLGTLDLYVFTDGTTLCLTPGHRETAEQLAGALERGEAPVLLGGSGVSGAYALTFTYGTESVFILADRVVASL